jgi:Ca2+-binding RTX toxin-like protein
MAFFNNPAQATALSLTWRLMQLGEASNLTTAKIKNYIKTYGTEGFGEIANADGTLNVDADSELKNWRPLGADKDPTDLASLRIDRLAILQKLNLVALDTAGRLDKEQTKKLLAAAGIDETFTGDNAVRIVDDPAQLLTENGFFRSFDPSGKKLSPKDAAEVKILAKYDGDKIVAFTVIGLGSNAANDLIELDTIADLSITRRYAHVLNALRDLAKSNGLSGKHVTFAGYSFGGGLTNSFYHLRKELATGFFEDSVYFGFDSPVLAPEDGAIGLYNFAAENDPVTGLFDHGRFNQLTTLKGFRETVGNLRTIEFDLWKNFGDILHVLPALVSHLGYNFFANNMSQLLPALLKDVRFQDLAAKVLKIERKTFADFVNRYPEIFDQKKPVIAAGNNNLVIYDDAYHAQGVPSGDVKGLINGIADFFNFQLNSNAVGSLGWLTHMTMVFANPVNRIVDSKFYDDMGKDSVVVLSAFSQAYKPQQGKIWVEDKKTPTSDHYGDAAFLLGTKDADLLRGGKGDDGLEGLGGNDSFDLSSMAGREHSTGTDIVYGGKGQDKVIVDGYREDYRMFADSSGTLYLYNPGTGLKELHDVEKLQFRGASSFGEALFEGIKSLVGAGKHKGEFSVNASGINRRQKGFLGGEFDRQLAFDQVSSKASAQDDILVGTDGNDRIGGDAGHDLVIGGGGDDTLSGDDGNDKLYGGKGNDTLWGGKGNDVLSGGYGDDHFYLKLNEGLDTILDFNTNANDRDVLHLDKSVFLDLDQLLTNATMSSDGTIRLSVNNAGVKLAGFDSLAEFKAFASSHGEAFSFA